MLNALYHHIRNNYPVIYFLTLFLCAIIIAMQMLSFIASNTRLLDTMGMGTLKTKIHAAKETAYWHLRAWQHIPAPNVKPEKNYGFLQSTNQDGTLNITVIKNDQYQTMRITLADTIVQNVNALAAIVAMHKHENAEFDFYPTALEHPYTVIWIKNNPFNLQIITAGIATPDTTPPTNVVDLLFAKFYLQQLTN